MNLAQGAATIILWQSRRFDTFDIAQLLGVSEADVCRLIDAARNRAYGPDLHVIEGAAV